MSDLKNETDIVDNSDDGDTTIDSTNVNKTLDEIVSALNDRSVVNSLNIKLNNGLFKATKDDNNNIEIELTTPTPTSTSTAGGGSRHRRTRKNNRRRRRSSAGKSRKHR